MPSSVTRDSSVISSTSSSLVSNASLPDVSDAFEEEDTVSDLSASPSLPSPNSRAHASSLGSSFTCTICSQPLPASSFYERGGHAYCAVDFAKTFLSCQICGERIIYGQGAEETEEERKERKRKEAAEGRNQQYLTLSEERIVHNRCLKCECCAKPLAAPLAPTAGQSTPTGAPVGSVSLFQSNGKYCQYQPRQRRQGRDERRCSPWCRC